MKKDKIKTYNVKFCIVYEISARNKEKALEEARSIFDEEFNGYVYNISECFSDSIVDKGKEINKNSLRKTINEWSDAQMLPATEPGKEDVEELVNRILSGL